MVISHRDIDPKNVMWNHDRPIIIDWESANYINPIQDLTETAIYWSEGEKGSIDKERFLTFVGSYKKRFVSLKADWKMALINGFSGKLGWLEYSLKRSLWIECTDAEEQRLGTVQVSKTIEAIKHYEEKISMLEEWLNTI